MTEKHADGDLPPPNMDVARAECLRKGVEAPSLAEMKDFFRFYAATSTPQIVEVPTAESLVSVAEWFFPAFTRETGTETSEEDRSEVFSWIRTTLVEEGVVANVSRPKHNFTVVDLNRILLCLWTEDDISWIPERYRVQFTFIFHVYCWTGARLGAFFKGGLLYKVGCFDWKIKLQILTPDRTLRLLSSAKKMATDGASSTNSIRDGSRVIVTQRTSCMRSPLYSRCSRNDR